MPICSTAGLLYLRLRPRLKCVGPSCHHVERGQPLHPIYASPWNSFHRGGCQEALVPPPVRSCIRRRPSRSAERYVDGVRTTRLVLIVRLCARVVQQLWRWTSMYVLRSGTGTILPSGPLRAIASFGTVEAHSLAVGASSIQDESRKNSDADLRPCVASGCCADHAHVRVERSARRRSDRCLLQFAWIVLLFVLPHPQDDRGNPPGDRQPGQIGLRTRGRQS